MQLRVPRLLATTVLVAAGLTCGDPRSLTKIDVDADKALAGVTLQLTVSGSGGDFVATYAGVDIPARGNPPLRVGLYLPAGFRGTVDIAGSASDANCEVATGQTSIDGVSPGGVSTGALTLMSHPCAPGDGGAGTTGAAGRDGGAGTTGAAGKDGGAGKDAAAGTTGGAGRDGGAGKDGAAGGAGGASPDAACTPQPVAIVCGTRCNIQVKDNCGNPVMCGNCVAPQTCGGGGTANVCGVCVDNGLACAGKMCGDVINNCGQTVTCGTCNRRQMCCAGRCLNVATCP